MSRYKLTIEYDGTHFSGWQIQPDEITVEQTLEEAFSQILQRPVDLTGQGRTDAGVHARGQTAHLDIQEDTDVQKLIFGVNGMTGDDIQVVKVEEVSPEFHARFDAMAREYEYIITTRPMPMLRLYAWPLRQPVDIDQLHQCAELLNGEFDFSGFSKFNEDNFTTKCEIQHSEFKMEGEIIRYRIRANRFLRNMVRRLVGTMVRTAQGKMTMEQFEEALKNPGSKIPTFTAPAKGLVLQEVFYK